MDQDNNSNSIKLALLRNRRILLLLHDAGRSKRQCA